MAAYCSCCGAEITLKAEACPACGMPRHGMLPPGQGPTAFPEDGPERKDSGYPENLKQSKPKTL